MPKEDIRMPLHSLNSPSHHADNTYKVSTEMKQTISTYFLPVDSKRSFR